VTFKIRDLKTGQWIRGTFDGVEQDLEYDTREMAEQLAPGCADYGFDPEVVEVP
jgi:hypothetical protein